MCLDPVTLIGLGMGGASAGLSIFQQRQETKYQNAVAEQTNRANALAAQRAYGIESAAQQAGVEENRQTVNMERTANVLKGTAAQGSALAAAGSSGVSGGALRSVLSDYARQTGMANADLAQSLRFSGQNAELQRLGTHERTIQESNMRRIGKAPKPGMAALGSAVLGGVNTGLSIYSGLR